MDGAIGRVQAALGLPSSPLRRVDPRGKEEDPRDFEQELAREGGEKPKPKTKKEEPAEPRPERPVDSAVGSRLDVTG
ncbi:MAG TPA: hypothetical protein ENJ09_14910 [Planctomycetes bacterium]|nr:hypothetical protein [Planctomycetota bacterium]